MAGHFSLINSFPQPMNRRKFLAAGLGAGLSGLGWAIPQIACASMDDYWRRDRSLWLRREDEEEYRLTYWSDGQLDMGNYERLCYLLRDKRESAAVQIDPALFDLLYGVQYWQELSLYRPVPLVIRSGYRTSRHNSKLEGASRDSMHQYGKAVDVQSPHFTPEQVAKMAAHFGLGGVGRYATHTHLDTGPVRHWRRK